MENNSMRNDFEKNVIHKQILDRVRFSEKANQYLPVDSSSGVDRGCADVVNVGWVSYQYQQSKLDLLQQKLDSAAKLIPEWRKFTSTEFMDDWGDGKEYALKFCAGELSKVINGE